MTGGVGVSWGHRGSAGVRDDALARYDDNRNGRITCKEARRHGIAPFTGRTPRTGTCAMGTETGSCASEHIVIAARTSDALTGKG